MVEVPAVSQLVVIGASAGGVDALSVVVSTLPPDFSAPIIIAQHLDPSRLSHLEQILGRRSVLPVRTVHDRERLEAGVVYVVPADRHVEIADHQVHVRAEPGRGRPAPSIDFLLATAAEAFGEQLIAVILTGLGSDGADGARRVKEAGGTVVIQNPQTAAHPDMPLSLAPTIIDIVAELEAIGPLLQQLLNGDYAPSQPDDERRLRTLLEQVRTRSGIDFSSYKEGTIRRRLQRRMLDSSSGSLDEYLQYLRRHPQEYERLANSFLIKVTDFFRDSDLFGYLREDVLPTLIGEARRSATELRLWSAGCATGEEAYSLAILICELLGNELDQFAVRVFATDLDGDAVAFARRGVYPASALSNLPPAMIERYFAKIDSGWEVRKTVRAMVIFGQHDLGQRAPFPRIDLVLCRNVLIYFTPELQRRALQLFAFALHEGGYLVLGKAETTAPLPEHFALVHPRLKVFRRQGERVVIPTWRIRDAAPLPVTTPPSTRPALAGFERELARVHARQTGALSVSERAEQVLLELPVGAVVVDRNYDIQSINNAARTLLGVHTEALGQDLVHLTHRSLSEPLRDLLDAALAGERPSLVHQVGSSPEAPGDPRFLELSAFVVRHRSEREDAAELVALTVIDVSERERAVRGQQATAAAAEARVSNLETLLDDATRTIRRLLAANQDLTTANAALRSANEELMVGNEESQAAMEEIETLNEEQQATNEELETLNEELQATVEELNTTNDDLQARTLELQERAAAQEVLVEVVHEEQKRLEVILANMSDAVMLVDTQGEIVLTNAAFKATFGDRLPPVEDASGQPLPLDKQPDRMAARGEAFTLAFTLRAADGAQRWYEASGQPIQSDGLSGGVVTIRDVSERSLLHLQEQFLALAGHELRTPLTALQSALQLLRRSTGTGAETDAQRYIDISLAQVGFLHTLVEDLADVIRIQSGELPLARAPLDLADVTRATVDLARPMADEQPVHLDIASEPVPLIGDRRRLQQVIINLISNAVQHGPSPAGVDVRLRAENGTATLQVTDHGPGIPSEHLPHLFERYYRREASGHRGLGVGLYLVKAIVTAHGGSVDVQSSESRGSTFTVRLPLAESPA